MTRRASGKLARALTLVGVFAAGFAADLGLAFANNRLGALAAALRWEKGTAYFYAETAARFVSQLHGALQLVLYVALTWTVGAAVARPLLERRRARGKASESRLAAAARRHPIFSERALPWGAGFAWLLLSVVGDSFFSFVSQLGWDLFNPGQAPFAWRVQFLSQNLHWALIRASNLGFMVASVLAVTGIAFATRFGVRKLTRDPEAPPERQEPIEDKGSFAAVAVTPATQGAVAGLAVASVAMAVYVARAQSNATLASAVFTYVFLALATATLFRRMSRIVVGIDGILVLGADRSRFYGYAGLDDVKASGSDILLQHRGRTSLRLQLHDEDVTRAPALAERIRSAMDHAARMRHEGADRLMQTRGASEGSQRLASSSRGGLDYRQPSIAREQLWQLVEGPVSDARSRRVAAEALASDMNEDERQRLRVVAEKCAEPKARVALQELLTAAAEPAEDDAEEELAPAIIPRRRYS